MEATIETNTNEEINVLRIKLDVVEKELQFAIDRAEKAEAEVEQFKLLYRSSSCNSRKPFDLNQSCGVCGTTITVTLPPPSQSSQATASLSSVPTLPPPPPPPMPNFIFHHKYETRGSSVSLSDGIAAFTLNNARESLESISSESNQQVKAATGRCIDPNVIFFASVSIPITRIHMYFAINN